MKASENMHHGDYFYSIFAKCIQADDRHCAILVTMVPHLRSIEHNRMGVLGELVCANGADPG